MWLLNHETRLKKKYLINEITAATYYPLQSNFHQKLLTNYTNLPGLEASLEVAL
jgi:hypothetical protein